MCGRYVVVSTVEVIEKRFQVVVPFALLPNYNAGPGTLVPVISADMPGEVQLMTFGLTPFWAKKRMYLFNARAEGDHNKDDDPRYTGAMGIIEKPAFRKSIRSRRCLIIADAFIEGSKEKRLDAPYLVHLGKGERPFAFAGIWDEWVDKSTGEVLRSCAIITTTPNEVLQAVGHHRSPVVLKPGDEKRWLQPDLPLAEVTALLRPYTEGYMNAYPIDTAIKHPRAQGPDLIKPTGPPIFSDDHIAVSQSLQLQGMGWSRGRSRTQ